jgi:hypothetical protein
MKFKQVKDYKLEALRIKKRKDEELEEDTSGMMKFHMVYTVDGVKSEQDISAVNIQKAEELIKKQYDGKNIVFTSKQQVKESFNNLKEAYGYKVSYDDLIEIQGKIDRLIRKMAENHQDEISPSSNTYRIGLPFIGTSEGYIDLQNTNQYIEGHEDDWDENDDYYESLKEDLEQETPQTANDTGLANMLIHAINGEWETISEYNDILTVIKNNGQFDMIPVIEDILSEENKHVGQLQKILETISGNVADISEGEQEASGQMSNETVDDDFGPNSGFDIYLV